MRLTKFPFEYRDADHTNNAEMQPTFFFQNSSGAESNLVTRVFNLGGKSSGVSELFARGDRRKVGRRMEIRFAWAVNCDR